MTTRPIHRVIENIKHQLNALHGMAGALAIDAEDVAMLLDAASRADAATGLIGLRGIVVDQKDEIDRLKAQLAAMIKERDRAVSDMESYMNSFNPKGRRIS